MRRIKLKRNNVYEIPRRKHDLLIEVCCIILLVGTLIYLVVNWGSIPDRVPMHYNAAGEITSFAGKATLLIVYVMALIMYIGLSTMERYPQTWNAGVKITEHNKIRIYRILKDMIKTTKLIIVVAFIYLTINTAMAKPLSGWFTPVFLVLIIGSIIFFTAKVFKNEFPKQ